ncbi:MAG: pectinesterase family protein [Gammaproteobacteria bacterium]
MGAVRAGPSFVVAQDGSGDFETIQGAIDAMKSFPPERITIHIRKGRYREKVVVHEWNTRLTIIGEDAVATIISFDDNFARVGRGRNSTFFTPTMQVNADDFVARNLTIENSAGAVGQAVALAVNANRAVFRNVRLLGNQDTLYVTGEGNRMFFDQCYIEGTTDFIFGGASSVFLDCTVHSKADSYVTAASTPEHAEFGLVFIRARLTASADVTAAYLGRPWRKHAQTVFIDSDMGRHIVPAGWHNWDNPEAESTSFYAEFNSSGPGGDPAKRVAWSKQLSDRDAAHFDVEELLRSGNHPGWWMR